MRDRYVSAGHDRSDVCVDANENALSFGRSVCRNDESGYGTPKTLLFVYCADRLRLNVTKTGSQSTSTSLSNSHASSPGTQRQSQNSDVWPRRHTHKHTIAALLNGFVVHARSCPSHGGTLKMENGRLQILRFKRPPTDRTQFLAVNYILLH